MFDLQNPARRAAELEAAILLHLRHHRHATADQLFQELEEEPGLTRSTLHHLLEDLEGCGKVRRLALQSGIAWCVRESRWGLPFWLIGPKF
jgi:hypothetical protein